MFNRMKGVAHLEKCWAESYCKGFPTRCGRYCIGYVQLTNIYALSNMPARYQHEITLTNPGPDRDAYILLKDFRDDVVHKVEAGSGVFIFSPKKGNGKTTWACKIMNEYFKNVALTNNLRCRGLFINVPQFLRDLRAAMDNPSPEMVEMQEHIKTASLVIWDDMGTETPSNWVRETLYTFINHREANGLSQIFTSNMLLEQLMDEKYLGERIVSRIVGQCSTSRGGLLIEFVGNDRRAD